MARLRRSRQAPKGSRHRRGLRAMARAGAFRLAYVPNPRDVKTKRSVVLAPYPNNLPPQENGPRWG